MLAAYDPESGTLEPTKRPDGTGWIDATYPTKSERALLRELGVPAELITDALDTEELSRVHHHTTGARLFVLRVPTTEGLDFAVIPLSVVTLPSGLVVTISATDTGLPTLLAGAKVTPSMNHRFSFLLAEEVASRFVATLHTIEADIDRLEKRIQASLENDEIMALLGHQKKLVFLDFALSSNVGVLERARDDTRFELMAEDRELVEGVLVETRQAHAVTRTKKELLGETMDALATVVSNNLNVAMKKIASLTLLASIPAIIAGTFGMNVPLPVSQAPFSFFAILVFGVGCTAALAAYLRAHKWV